MILMATDSGLRDAVPGMVERLLDTYGECPSIHHLDHCPLPSRDAVIRILDDLHEVLYPGFGRRQNLQKNNVHFYVGQLMVNLHDALTEQIARSIKHDCDDNSMPVQEFEGRAQQMAVDFLDTLPDVRRTLADDVQSAYDGDPASVGSVEIVFSYPGLEAMTVFRVAHELHRLGVPLIPRMMTEHAHSKTGIDIHPGAKIGRSFFIDHGTGVVIGATCVIGDNVKLYQGVTLGALSFPKDSSGNYIRNTKRHPTLEDDVVVYANASILGGETVIGHHSVIGSNVWLTKGVPPYTLVTMETPHLRLRGGQFDSLSYEI